MKYIILFAVIIMIAAACSSDKAADQKKPATASPRNYTLATVEKGGLSSSVKLPAQLAAYQEVSIFPKVNGYVKTVHADIGSKVAAGSLLMVLEAPELVQAAMQAKEKYARSKADYSIDKEHYMRLLQASATSGAISPLDLSTIRSKMEADSAVSNAENANWEMAKIMLGYLQVRAPFAGVVTERNVHPGALVSAAEKSKPMLELKDIDHLRLQVDIPENIAGNLAINDTMSFFVSAFPARKMIGTIKRKASNIDPRLRSERIEMDIPNKEGLLTPGMFADVVVYPKGSPNALCVPVSAVVTTTERKYVLLANGANIKKVDVTTGTQTMNKVEIYGAVKEGDHVIAPANDDISESGK